MGSGFINVDIERLVTWALRDQGLGWSSDSSFSAAAQIAVLGTIVDTSPSGSHPSIALFSDDDALVVHRAISMLPPKAAALVTCYGRSGLRPDWAEEGEGKRQQLTDARGRKRWIWDNPVNRTGNKYPMMGFVGLDPESVRFERANYAAWHEALVGLVGAVNGEMARHVATGPAAPAEPWTLPKPVVHGVEQNAVRRPRPPQRYDLAEQMRSEAQAPVRARASDWTVPAADNAQEESRPKRRAHGGA